MLSGCSYLKEQDKKEQAAIEMVLTYKHAQDFLVKLSR